MAKNEKFRPILAASADWEDYEKIFHERGTLLASPKLDGIRATVIGGVLSSRTLKPIRNRYIQSVLGRSTYEGLDGEIVVGLPHGEGVFARTSSGVMSYAGSPDFIYYVFENWNVPGAINNNHFYPSCYYQHRYGILKDERRNFPHYIQVLPQSLITSLKELEEYEKDCYEQGYEGAILRDPNSPYKLGRSTLREKYMLKLKRFVDREARIVGFKPLYRNLNEATVDKMGLQKRSSVSTNMIADDLLGALEVKDVANPAWEFNIGTGFDVDTRTQIWKNQQDYLGKVVKYRYLPVGTLEKPRHPVYLGIRDLSDL
jgi:DNA ligase-1